MIHLHSWHLRNCMYLQQIIRTHLTETFFRLPFFNVSFFLVLCVCAFFSLLFLLSLSFLKIFICLFLRHWYDFFLSIDNYGIDVQLEHSIERHTKNTKFNHKNTFLWKFGATVHPEIRSLYQSNRFRIYVYVFLFITNNSTLNNIAVQ